MQDAGKKMAAAGIYSEIPELNLHLMKRMGSLGRAGYTFEDARPIAYGTVMTFRRNDALVQANAYYSAKKGLSLVVNPRVPEQVSRELTSLFLYDTNEKTAISSDPREQAFKCWIGSDESGKGDYLGPLVTAAFRADREIAGELRGMGVRDSKQVSDPVCRKLARELFLKFKDRISVVELIPETYNRLYGELAAQGHHLNWLLGWCHAKASKDLLGAPVDAVIIDKFAHELTIRKQFTHPVKLILRVRAEDNVAVAAASILARGRYLYRLEKLSEQYGVKLINGAGQATDASAVEYVRKHGFESLRFVAKLHFRNTAKVTSRALF
jgi:ribonuclease HIII